MSGRCSGRVGEEGCWWERAVVGESGSWRE